jgi:UrcA family protein
MSRFIRITTAIAAICLTAAVTAPASAAEADVPAVTVPMADLDLTTQAGVTALHKRILAAANHVCGTLYVNAEDFESCKVQTLGQGLRDMRQAVAANDDHIRLARTTQMMTAAIKP